MLSREQGKLEEAIEAYKKALALKPDYAEAYSNMGVALKGQGKLEEAIEAFNRALSVEPENADGLLATWAMLSKSRASWKRQ